VAEGWGFHISKGYIYAAMAFSVFVEILNLRMRKNSKEAVHLRDPERASLEAEIPVPGASGNS
jgi:predicted tellurium resistance membrane protein TerC